MKIAPILLVACVMSSPIALSLTTLSGAQTHGWLQSTVNGHWYAISVDELSWPDGESLAVSLGGHLVTVRNQDEQTWIETEFAAHIAGVQSGWLWMGLNDVAEEGVFEWTSGEPYVPDVFNNWDSNQPDDGPGSEDWCNFFPAWTWNDCNTFWCGDLQAVIELEALPPDLDCNSNGIPDDEELQVVTYCECDSGAPCGNTDPNAGCANFSGVGSLLTACGSSSIADDDLVLTAASLPANNFGIVFMGATQAFNTFGNGILCVDVGGLGVFRFPVHNTGASGSIVEGPGIVAYSQTNFSVFGTITAGQTWNFQGWYRDPGGPCGNTHNLSNGLAVTFGP